MLANSLGECAHFDNREDKEIQRILGFAKKYDLAHEHGWFALLHYRKSHFSGKYFSEIDDPNFFFAPLGKHNPHTELVASIKALFFTPEKEKLRCRFPARYYWLSKRLNTESQHTLESLAQCGRFINWRDHISARSIVLVYPASYLNSPSSMFGHTFLRLDKDSEIKDRTLLGVTINYAAEENSQDNEIEFAYKGIFGGYPGIITVQPYYEKVNEYSDWENRDIWEYRLNLTFDEIDQLIRHVWELRHTRIDYFFIDENCSYRLLRLLEVARPTLNLTKSFRHRAIPADTVRAVVRAGLVQDTVYRASTETQLRHHISQLNPGEKKFLQMIVDDDNPDPFKAINEANIGHESHSKILDVAYEYLHYRLIGDNTPRRMSARKTLHRILLERSKLERSSDFSEVPIPTTRDDQGHSTTRFSTGFGSRDGKEFMSIQLRSAYHDLTDPPSGYRYGAAIEFMDIGLRVYESNHIQLEKATLLEIESLSPRDEFFKPWSWTVSLAAKRKPYDGKRPLLGSLQGGSGVSYGSDGNMIFAILSANLEISDTFSHKYALGPSARVGGIYRAFGGQGVIEFNHTQFIFGDRHGTTSLNLDHTINLSTNHALGFNLSHERSDGNGDNELSITYRYYF